MRVAVKRFKALSDETRLRLLLALRHGERCVCELIELVGLSPSTVSKHLSILRDAGWVDARKDGRWVHYRLADPSPLPLVGKKAAPIFQALENTPQVREDDRRLLHVAKHDANALCPRGGLRMKKGETTDAKGGPRIWKPKA